MHLIGCRYYWQVSYTENIYFAQIKFKFFFKKKFELHARRVILREYSIIVKQSLMVTTLNAILGG